MLREQDCRIKKKKKKKYLALHSVTYIIKTIRVHLLTKAAICCQLFELWGIGASTLEYYNFNRSCTSLIKFAEWNNRDKLCKKCPILLDQYYISYVRLIVVFEKKQCLVLFEPKFWNTQCIATWYCTLNQETTQTDYATWYNLE